MLTPHEFMEVVSHCDFDVEVTERGTLKLIDLQHANLGGIEGEEFETYTDVFERMTTYLVDYIFTPLIECIWEDFKVDLDDRTFEEVVQWCDDHNKSSWAYHLRLVCQGAD